MAYDDNQQQFLQQFKKIRSVNAAPLAKRTDEIFFMICFDGQNRAYLRVVDHQGKDVETDYRLYNDSVFTVLRSFERAKIELQDKISWGDDDENVYLDEYRWVLLELLRCSNLVDKDMAPIGVADEQLQLKISIEHEPGNQLKATALVVGDNVMGRDFKLLADDFVLFEGSIYPLRPIGDNYASLGFFLITFPEAWLETYLSVLFSYTDNVIPLYDDYRLVESQEAVPTVPTIIFEKVDEDMALYLRLVNGIDGFDFDFVQRFDLVYVARLTMEHIILKQRIAHRNNAQMLQELRQVICNYAPVRKKKEVYLEGDLFIIPQQTAGPFLLGALPQLVRDYRLVGSEKLRGYKVQPAQPQFKMNVSSGIDFLEGTASVFIGEEEFSLKKFLAQYRKNKYITLADGDRAIIDEAYIKRLERIYHGAGKDGTIKVSFFDLPDIEELMQQRLEGEVFERHRAVYEGFNHIREQQMRFNQVHAVLRDYQKEGVKWINYIYEHKLGGCLADDMGLGKTLQTITMLTRIYPKVKKPSLIVMPRTLLFNWQEELQKFAPQLSFSIYYGNQRDLKKALESQLVLTTYALVRNDIKQLLKKKFHYIILDESQNIKNVSAQTTQAIALLQGEHRLALSGTPIENNLTELYSLFRFLNPTMFGSLEEFNREYTLPIQNQGDKSVMAALRRKIYPFILRRLKRDVLEELPDLTEQTLYCEMSDEQAYLYEERRRYYYGIVHNEIKTKGIAKSQFVMFQALSELRRIASVPESLSDGRVTSSKIDLLVGSIVDAVSNGHKVVAFFNFIAGIELVSEKLEQEGIDFATMTGSTRDRKRVVERFQNDEQCRVMLMTLKTGGVGLNLTEADMVYIFEPWWNKAAEQQAINRLHRIGQKQKVMSFSVITRNTIEEKIRLLQQQKAELFEGLIGADSSSTKMLSEEDIDFILSE